jgi:[protein-PII] uridylyltransferase
MAAMNQVSNQKSIHAKLNALIKFDADDSVEQILPQAKQYLEVSNQYLKKQFQANINIRNLVLARARHIDWLLVKLWNHLCKQLGIEPDKNDQQNRVSVIAVGGYGRGELHPFSDIDLLILSDQQLCQSQSQVVEKIIALLWDCHLKVGQSVRTLEQCLTMAAEDVSIVTNIMESRLLVGDSSLFSQMVRLTTPDKMWIPRDFFEAKTEEQRARYYKFDSSSFDLEPNLKSSPGGLRDIQMLSWISQRIYYPHKLFELVKEDIITKKEHFALVRCQLFLWKVRFALHLVTGKAEDRLLFDHQKNCAKMMGFKDTKNSLAVEKMMKRYYRSVLIVRNISEILLQINDQAIKNKAPFTPVGPPTVIDDNFQIINQRIDAIDKSCFIKNPSLLLSIFIQVALNQEIIGISAKTLRAIQAARYKINNSFRNKKSNNQLFISFWHILHTTPRAMFLMKRSGILADYLLTFKKITGQMQYDMFHNYTVDEHTLFLLKNLTDFANPELSEDFPLCSEIMQRQTHPETIFLAGLFHDIGKGRGGDHSEIGAIEAIQFGKKHKIESSQIETISWLVGNHLLMSLVAQKRDISDPKVIKNFAELVGDQDKLELLYILTVADIRATSNNLWNSWKDALLRDLYLYTSNYFKQETVNLEQVWESNKAKAKTRLLKKGFDDLTIEALWKNLDEEYFSKRSPNAIAWQMERILKKPKGQSTVIGIQSTSRRSGSEVFVFTKDKANLFATLTATLNQKGLTIQAANIYTDKNSYCYDSFFVLDSQGNALTDKFFKRSIKQAILTNITNISKANLMVQRRMPRQFKYFSIPTKVEFFNDEYTGFTRMELTTRDQSGLLAAIGKAFKTTNVRLHDARINTLGEKVEDIFIISSKNNAAIIDLEMQQDIRSQILRNLSKNITK